MAAANVLLKGVDVFWPAFTKDPLSGFARKNLLGTRRGPLFTSQYPLKDLAQAGFFAVPQDSTVEFNSFLEIAIRYQKRIFIKINRNTSFKEIDYLTGQLKALGILYQTTLISPKKDYLVYLRNQDLDLDLQLETDAYSDELFLDCCKYHFDLVMRVTGFMKKMVYIAGLYHDYKLKVGITGLDKADVLAKYASIPVDYIFTGGTE